VTTLADYLEDDLSRRTLPSGIEPLHRRLQQHYGAALAGIYLYGSCRRHSSLEDGLVDLLVVVHDYRSAQGGGLLALANWLLPPNVFYLEATGEAGIVRCKYAVVSTRQFARRCRSRMDHYFWARFGQPMSCVQADSVWSGEFAAARADALETFAHRVSPLTAEPLDASEFWVRAMMLTYRCELRPEPPDSARRLIGHDPDYWHEVTHRLADAAKLDVLAGGNQFTGTSGSIRRVAVRLAWWLRRIGGKLFNLARLLKAAGTFSNGIDYIVWKVERHSGVRVEPTERMRRHPRLAAWGLVWRMWRAGGFR
jgi:hypothetical protein